MSSLSYRAVLGQGKQTFLCLPRAQSQRNGKKVDFNLVLYCQLTFTGVTYVPGDLPAFTYFWLAMVPAGHGTDRKGESQRG